MDDSQFFELVKRYEELRKSSTQSFILAALLETLVGAAFIFLLLSLCLAAFVFSSVRLFLVEQNLALSLISAMVLLWSGSVLSLFPFLFKGEPVPGEFILPRDRFPSLYTAIQRLGGRSIADVVLAPESRIYLRSTLTAGILCGVRYRLVLGYGACQALPADYFEAILAHEIGHLKSPVAPILLFELGLFKGVTSLVNDGSAGKGRFLRNVRLLAFAPLSPLFQYYRTRLRAMNLVLNRQLELDADSYAVKQFGTRTVAGALLLLTLKSHQFEREFEPEIWKEAQYSDRPCSDLFTRWRMLLNENSPLSRSVRLIREKLEQPAQSRHPGLRERLESISFEIEKECESTEVFAGEILARPKDMVDKFFGFAGDGFLELEMNRLWLENNRSAWWECYRDSRAN